MNSPIAEMILSGIGAIALWLLNDAVSQLRQMKDSISALNEKMGIVVTRVDSHESRIAHLEKEN